MLLLLGDHVATATLVHLKTNQDGTKASMLTKYSATLFVNAATTVSFTAGVDKHTITDSGGGFAAATLGDQIEVSGSVNDDNNGFFKIETKTSSTVIVVERRGDGSETNGVTEGAGPTVTVSLVPQNTQCTNGTVSLSNGAVMTIENTAPQSEAHEVYMFSACTVNPPILHQSVDGDVTMTATAGDAWTDGAGNISPAFSSTAITNYSKRLDANANFDYDNNYLTVHGIGDAPYGVGTAVDPSTNANITEWWAPDLESGYSDEDDINTLVGQLAVKNLTPRSGTSWDWKYDTSSIQGKTSVRMKNHAGQEWRSAWTGMTAFGGAVAKTIIAVIYTDDPEGAFTVYRTLSSDDSSSTIVASRFNARTGCMVVAVRDDGSGSGDAWVNYVRESWAVPAGQARIMNAYLSGGITTSPRVGRIYEIGEYVSDANMDTYVRWLLNFYGDADWAPQFHISENGSDSNIGSVASPLLTLAGADKFSMVYKNVSGSDPVIPSFSPHYIIPEGETVAISLFSDVVSASATRVFNGYSDANWGCVRVSRSSSSPYPTFYTLGASGLGEQNLVTATGGGVGRVARRFGFWGSCPREPRKIPTNSPLRKVGDAAFSSGYTTQEKMVNIVGSDTDPDPTILEISLFNCHSVGGGLISAQSGRFLEKITLMFDFGRVSYAHAHGAGHTNPLFLSGPYTVFISDKVTPSPGWEPIDSVEIDDVFSHDYYDQYGGVGVKIISDSFVAETGSHSIQFRSGGGIVMDSIVADPAIGFFCASTSVKTSGLLIEGGKDIDGSPRGWALDGSSITDYNISNTLVIGSTYTTNGRGINVNNTDDFYSTDPTVGAADGASFVDMNGGYKRVVIERATFFDRPNVFMEFTGVENSSLTDSVISADTLPIKINNTDSFVTTGTHTMTNNGFDIGDSTLGEVDGVAKTLAQYEALLDTTSGNTETAEVFVDNTRSVREYAKTYLSDGTADPLDLSLEMVRQRWEGTYDSTLEVGYIRNWVYKGFVTTSGKGVSPDPYVVSSTPSAGESGVDDTVVPQVVFNEDMIVNNGSSSIELRLSSDGSLLDSITASAATISGTEITLTGLSLSGETGLMYIRIPSDAFKTVSTDLYYTDGVTSSSFVFSIGDVQLASHTISALGIGMGFD